MKKIISFLLLSLYLLSVEGMSISRHFCAGVVAGIEYFDKFDEQDCCGVEECDDCCYDETITLKIKEEHLTNKFIWTKSLNTSEEALPVIEFSLLAPFSTDVTAENNVVFKRDERNLTRRLLYIDHCSWLI